MKIYPDFEVNRLVDFSVWHRRVREEGAVLVADTEEEEGVYSNLSRYHLSNGQLTSESSELRTVKNAMSLTGYGELVEDVEAFLPKENFIMFCRKIWRIAQDGRSQFS